MLCEPYSSSTIQLTNLLLSAGRRNSIIISLLLTEQNFRSPVQRLLEYCAWAILSLVWPRRLESLSVGIGQLKLRHWCNFGLVSGVRFSLHSLCVVSNPVHNYDAIRMFLALNCGTESFDPVQVSNYYTGRARKHYVTILTEHHQWILKSVGGTAR